MKLNLKNRISNWISLRLYALLIAGNHEDYISESNGKTVVTPAGMWQKKVLEDALQRN